MKRPNYFICGIKRHVKGLYQSCSNYNSWGTMTHLQQSLIIFKRPCKLCFMRALPFISFHLLNSVSQFVRYNEKQGKKQVSQLVWGNSKPRCNFNLNDHVSGSLSTQRSSLRNIKKQFTVHLKRIYQTSSNAVVIL